MFMRGENEEIIESVLLLLDGSNKAGYDGASRFNVWKKSKRKITIF